MIPPPEFSWPPMPPRHWPGPCPRVHLVRINVKRTLPHAGASFFAAPATADAAEAVDVSGVCSLGELASGRGRRSCLVDVGRSVPSVLRVRVFLRPAKTGGVAVLAGVILVNVEAVPFAALFAMLVFAGRAFALLLIVRPAWRARTVGMVEAVLGVVFVIGLAVAWRI